MEGERDSLIPIGRFAFLSRLSRRTLRFYDERALLKPAFVDELPLLLARSARRGRLDP